MQNLSSWIGDSETDFVGEKNPIYLLFPKKQTTKPTTEKHTQQPS